MKKSFSLKWFVAISFLALGLLLVFGYSWLAARYFMLGMDNMLTMQMEQAGERYLSTVPKAQRSTPRDFEGFLITPDWQQLPAEMRRAFGSPPVNNSELVKQGPGVAKPPEELYFLIGYQQDDDRVFISRSISPATISSIVESNVRGNLHTLALISGASALALAAIIWLLLQRVSGPVARLGNWTRSLNPEMLKAPVPDFSYPELNDMAELIRNSLTSVEESLEREHRFLRHASHELRTPITTVRSNAELLRKLKEESGGDPREQLALERIERASLTMKHLTETLLWLGRDSGERLPENTFALDQLVRQLAADLDYLLRDKEVSLEIDTEPCEVTLPEVVARILLGNLIRNAFQHTSRGSVAIRQRNCRVEIFNQQHNNGDTSGELGFGLGLQLTARLSERLGWRYVNRPQRGGRRAILWLTES
ncbi:sensor histidine kinase [Microbulbifer taiwanensis]|uniref:histidine kinase n=1 Tax=Microbulbifer taiwanensis TaxID=986746 RepID=A0ABW1YMD4_9GAMM|nr:HAMP domain-containing sensor histidine kinase [Microbulbifer taiwanensis]